MVAGSAHAGAHESQSLAEREAFKPLIARQPKRSVASPTPLGKGVGSTAEASASASSSPATSLAPLRWATTGFGVEGLGLPIAAFELAPDAAHDIDRFRDLVALAHLADVHHEGLYIPFGERARCGAPAAQEAREAAAETAAAPSRKSRRDEPDSCIAGM